jgi:hypothetical protein
MSEPTSSAVRPAASAAALPPLLPPGVRARSHGLFVRPWIGFDDCQSASIGGTFVLPISTAPAARRRDHAGASCSETNVFQSGTPHVVPSPATLIDSFSVIGRPCNARASPLSAARAACRARATSRTTTALSFVSYISMRRM